MPPRSAPLLASTNGDRVDTKRQVRRNRVLQAVIHQGPISKFDLAKRLNYTAPSAGETVDELERLGLIRRSGVVRTAVGRRPVLFEVRAEAAHVLGIDFGRAHTAAVAMNLAMEAVARADGPTLYGEIAEIMVEHLRPLLAGLLRQLPRGRRTLQGIGLAVPGLVDRPRGQTVSRDMRFRLLRQALESEHGVPTFLENDAMAMAMAELWFGRGRGRRHFVSVNLGHGIGMGIIADGSPLRGHHGHTGEIGHARIAFPGEPCPCGGHGCLETVASGWALAQRAREIIERQPASALARLAAGGAEPTALLVVEAAHHGDPQARALLEDAGRQIGRALATAVNVLNPEAVIIGGRLSQVTDLIVTPLAASLRESILPAFRDDLVIEASDLREEAGPLGAGALAFHEMLQANPRTLQQYV